MAYDFQKTYTLIAQTPLIHFQHDQEGATLRATEVKPKLDRYLIDCAAKEGKNIDSWYIGYNFETKKNNKECSGLNYKIRIECQEAPRDSDITLEDCKFYFGNQGDSDKKELIFKNCKLEIISFIPEFMMFIDEHLEAFFVLHNFGTRQTKGFGAFRLAPSQDGITEKQTNDNIDKIIQNSHQHYFYVDISNQDSLSVKDRFNHALTIYSVMKNGLNMTKYNPDTDTYDFPERYIKGYAMRPYFDDGKNKQTGSDKAFIKSNVWLSDYDEPEDVKYSNYTFIRAILGLAEQYEFRDDLRNCGSHLSAKGKTVYHPIGVSIINCAKKADGTPDIDMNKNMTKLKETAEIQRFPSPVLIKIYQHRIYFLFNDSYKTILDKLFLFVSFRKPDKDPKYETIRSCIENGHYLVTPKSFDVDTFISNFVSYYNEIAKKKLTQFAYPYKNSKNITLKKGGKKYGFSK